MARIRTIKPEFWTSEQIVECSTNARLLFVGLWNFCDDEGRHVCAPMRIKMEVFPADSFTGTDIRRMLDELSSNGLIVVYDVDGQQYLQVTGWKKHQKIDRPQPSKIPEPSSNIRRTLDDHSLLEGNGREGKGEKKESIRAVGKPTRTEHERFPEFWMAYPKRDGANPRWPAAQKFSAVVAAGIPPEKLIVAATRYAEEVRRKGKERTEYVKQALVWFNQRLYEDYGPPSNVAEFKPQPGQSSEELRAKYASTELRPNAPVVERSNGQGSASAGMVRSETRLGRAQGVAEILRRPGMDPVIHAATGTASAMHAAMPVAGMDDYGNATKDET